MLTRPRPRCAVQTTAGRRRIRDAVDSPSARSQLLAVEDSWSADWALTKQNKTSTVQNVCKIGDNVGHQINEPFGDSTQMPLLRSALLQ